MQTYAGDVPDRKRTFGSTAGSTVGAGQRSTERVLSYRRLLLSRAKLKATSRTSALLSGFAIIAMVEIQLNDDLIKDCSLIDPNCTNSCPTRQNCYHYNRLLIAFTVVTTLLIATHMFALLISTCILPNLEAVNSITGSMDISESPHDKFRLYIEVAWICSTGFGIILFLVEIGLLCWIKFFNTYKSALAATIILIPLVLLFAFFAVEFYRRLIDHKEATTTKNVQELDDIFLKLEEDNNNQNCHSPQLAMVTIARRDSDGLSCGSNGSDDAEAGGGVVY